MTKEREDTVSVSDTTERAIKIIAQISGIKPSLITAERSIKSLDFDSIDGAWLLIALEDEFAIDLVDEDALACKTVQDLIDLVDKEIGRQA